MSIQSRINMLRMCIYFIASVCVYDIYCTVKYSMYLHELEQNPIAKTLISTDIFTYVYYGPIETIKNEIVFTHIDVSKLVLFKVLGLIASLEIFDWLIASKYINSTTFIILLISSVQLALLFFLLV